MKTTGVLPEALAASTSRFSRSEIATVVIFARSTRSRSGERQSHKVRISAMREQDARDVARERSRLRLRDYALTEQFVLDYARYPELPDEDPSRWVLLRGRAANIAARAA